jgi:hypothetical protein
MWCHVVWSVTSQEIVPFTVTDVGTSHAIGKDDNYYGRRMCHPFLKYYPSISLVVLRKTSVRKANFWNDV